MCLNEAENKKTYKVVSIDGDSRFISRILSIGMTIDLVFTVVKNKGKMPIVIFLRDTMLAISSEEAKKIQIEGVA